MPNRKRSEEVVAEIPSYSNCVAQGPVSRVGTVTNQQGQEEEPVTSVSTTPTTEAQRREGLQSVDVAAEELLAASPFWSLLFKLATLGGNQLGPATLAQLRMEPI